MKVAGGNEWKTETELHQAELEKVNNMADVRMWWAIRLTRLRRL